MKSMRALLVLALASTIPSTAVIPDDSSHIPVSCGISFRGPDRQIDLQGLADLPEPLQGILAQHISDRVGSQYASALIFDSAQLKNLDAPQSPDPMIHPLARRLYNLLYHFRLSPEQNVSACVLLEPNGNIVQGLSLPALAHGAKPPLIVTLSAAKVIANKYGMSKSREVEIRYFPDTDTLEWLFTRVTREDGPSISGKILHIPVQDPAGIHWSNYEAIR